jgi:hypothetical protein
MIGFCLALWLQSLTITRNYSAIADSQNLQSPRTSPHSPFPPVIITLAVAITLHDSLAAPSRIRTNSLKVFTSRVLLS